MLFTQFTFLGIDPTAGRRPFTYAALDEDLKLLALSQGEMEEILAFVGGQRQAYVAVCGPRRPNQQLMRRPEIRSELNPSPRPGRWLNCRLVEYQLRQRGIRAHLTPADRTACPLWKQTAFKLYERLEAMGYRPYPAGEKTPTQYLEVYPHASFATLMVGIPFPKHTLEGRLQRQLILHECGLGVPDPLRFFEEITRHRLLQGILPLDEIYTPQELDAMVAAYTAWKVATKPQETMRLGHKDEGEIVLPVPALIERY